MFSSVCGHLGIAEVLPGYRHHRKGAAVISRLLEKGSISQEEYFTLTGPHLGRKLLAENVFSFNYANARVSFQSTMVKRFCEHNRSFWKPGWFWYIVGGFGLIK
jgi:hypothetical protein